MPLVQFKIPDLNPLHFVDAVPTVLPQFNYKHFADWQFKDTIRYFEQMVDWYQPWQKNDPIRLQLLSEVGPIKMTMIDYSTGEPVDSGQNLVQKQQSFFFPGLFIYELDLDLSVYPSGTYQMMLEFSYPVLARVLSNPFIVDDLLIDTTRIDYKHSRYWGDTYFETGFSPAIRTWGTMGYDKPGSINVIYPNQNLDMQLVNGKPFNVWRYWTGGPEGIPDFMMPKLNSIFCLSDIKIEGRYYTKATEGSNFEDKSEEGYPMRGWSIELREKLNRPSRTWVVDPEVPLPGENGGQNIAGLTVAVVVETKAFVSDDNGGSYHNVPVVD